ncbi:amidohydrolase [Vineibacter terrae]|uniref:Amidohydrolase n=1 Tax=Vineibacter terrae TaxID=2586908 RepID=A0A5C8PQM7_9HYPH|nr:amidohydrolase family protein [Vineibacter terrae]TXL77609.1 amidohydrolase [Vineibacter terrae]
MSTTVDPALISNDFLRVRPDWLALRTEAVLEPDLPIVDPHHHLWDHPGNPYLLSDLLADTGSGHSVMATVYVEARSMYRAGGPIELRSLGETEFVNGIAAMSASGAYGPTAACAAIIGNVDLRLGSRARAALEAHVAVSGGRFRGIRNVSAWHPDGIKATSASPPQGLLLDRGFRDGFACLAPLGLTFDAWLMHTQLDEVLDLARAFPDTTIVLDHVGGPVGIGPYVGQREAVFAAWAAAIRALARCPNVNVKLGGLGMHLIGFDFHARPQPPSSQDLASAWKPYIETCIAAFGAGRCMFESNFPVDKGTCSYRVLWNAFKRLTTGFSADEKAALYSGTARKVYRLPG